MIDILQENLKVDASLMRSVAEEVKQGRMLQLTKAHREQRKWAREQGAQPSMKHGYKQMRIHPDIFHHWGRRLGYECWHDKQFLKEMMTAYPEMKVAYQKKPMISFGQMLKANEAADRYNKRKTVQEARKNKTLLTKP